MDKKKKKKIKKKISIYEKKEYIKNFVYKNIKYINNNIIIEEFESDFSSSDEEIILEDELENEFLE
tara:strand:- start:33 stop:230 length:198 start_codon:yes stop_codon:yes gene_type:complete